MPQSPEKAKGAVGAAAKKASDQTRQKLDEAKRKIGFGKLFQEFLSNLRKGNGKESLKSLTALLAVFFGGKLADLKADVENEKKKKGEDEESQEEENTEAIAETEDAVADSQEPANDNATSEELPDDLTGVPYTRLNLAKCKDFEQCQALMKANGFYLDKGSGNYINREWISPDKALKEPLVTDSLYEGGKKIRLKKSVMARLKKADESMFAETGEHIKVGEHFRTNAHQFELFKKYNSIGPDGKVKNTGRVAYPGYSFHEIGQAVDLPLNWEKAQKYMWAAGFIGGKAPIGLARDANHFSVGEIGMTDKRVAALKAEGIQVKGQAPMKAA